MTISQALLGWLLTNICLALFAVAFGIIVDIGRGFWRSHVARLLGEDQERDRLKWARRRAIVARRRQEAEAHRESL